MIKKIFLVHHTHTDIGYTDIQTKVIADHIDFLEAVLRYCRQTDDYPEDVKFRWTCETAWQLENYFRNKPEKVEEVIKRVKEGRIEITGFYLNMTDLYSLEMLIRSLYFCSRVREKYGINIISAMNSDINGLSWNVPQILNKIDIKYLLMATNEIKAFAPKVPRPFWWSSPEGSKVLVWNSGRESCYSEGLYLGFGESEEKVEKNLPEYLKETEKGYPYDALCLQVAMDNQPPLIKVCDIVKEWNKKGKSPEIIISTPVQFFRYMEGKYYSKFPEYKLAWPDWWADGNGSCALETSFCLNSYRKIIENEAICSFLNLTTGVAYPFEKIKEIWENLFFFSEHTFGVNESVKNPFSIQTLGQWAIKSNFIYQAAIRNELLYKDGIGVLKETFPEYQEDVITPLEKKETKDLIIENNFYRIEVDKSRCGIKSIYDKKLREQLVDKNSQYGFNQYIYENIKNPEGRNAIWNENSSESLWSPRRKRVDTKFIRYNPSFKSSEIFENKNLKKIVITMSGKGCYKIVSEISLPFSEKRVDIANTIWKEEILEPEGIYFAFPFNFKTPKIRLCGPGKDVFEPEKVQLPSTSRDHYSIEDWLIIRDKRKSIVWLSPDAPLVQFNQINTGKWLNKLLIKNGTIFSYVMNNYWHTNFKASQSGTMVFCYSFTSQKRGVKNSSAHIFSLNHTQPTFCKIANLLFKFDKKNLITLSFKKSEDKKGFILRVKEMNGRKTSFNLRFPYFKKVKIFLAKPTEEKIKKLPYQNEFSFIINPFEIVTFYLLGSVKNSMKE